MSDYGYYAGRDGNWKWSIHIDDDERDKWWVCREHEVLGCSPIRSFPSGTEAIAAFAAGGR